MKPLLRAAPTAVLVALLAASPARAGSPSASVSWSAPGVPSDGSLLLVLERGPSGWVLADARSASVRPKLRQGPVADAEGPWLALWDAEGRPLLASRLRVPEQLHGPRLEADGRPRCVAVADERPVIALRLPRPAGLASLTLLQGSSHSPSDGAELARALSARPSDFGLETIAEFRLELDESP